MKVLIADDEKNMRWILGKNLKEENFDIVEASDGEEAFNMFLDEEPDLVILEDDKKCPNCGNPINAGFNVCPVCKETLKKKCSSCGNMVDINWKYCPYCKVTLRKGD